MNHRRTQAQESQGPSVVCTKCQSMFNAQTHIATCVPVSLHNGPTNPHYRHACQPCVMLDRRSAASREGTVVSKRAHMSDG